VIAYRKPEHRPESGPSRRAEELDGRNGVEVKPAVWFEKAGKALVLNKTNADVLMAAFGPETEAWIGQVVEVYPTRVYAFGKQVDAVRLRVPAPQAPPARMVANGHEPDDDDLFA